MLYTVASETWSAGNPLPPSAGRPGLHRTRAGAAEVAAGRPLLVVSVRYDAIRSLVVAQDLARSGQGGLWSAQAIVDDRGVITVLAPIPAALVRLVAPARIRIHPGTSRPVPERHPKPDRPRSGGMPAAGSSGLLPLKARRFLQGSRQAPDRAGRPTSSG